MSPNGRRAWRRMMRSRRKRKVAGLVFGPDTKARASLVSATRGFHVGYWRRHKDSMHVEGGLRLCCLVPNHQSPISITARSLVGMTMGARKRNGLTPDLILQDYYLDLRLRPCPGCFDCAVECWVCHEPHEPPDELCGGSGVIRAGKLRPLLRKPDCGFYID
jgi:hypothetical protein